MDYKIKDDKVIIKKEDFTEESEIQYLAFIIGYDLLNTMLKKDNSHECELNYNFCDRLSRKFIKSEEYQDTRYSTYEMLKKWLNTHKVKIKKTYKELILKTNERAR